jgi:cytochrome c-type biogenesis protein CcmE
MKPRHRRLVFIVLGVGMLGSASALVLNAFQSNLVFFNTPTEVAAGTVPSGRAFRLGGLVEEGSLRRDAQGLGLQFVITDTAQRVTVRYSGMLPDLFQEGKGVVAQGRLAADGRFVADTVLAKHDENYMPPEAGEALKRAGQSRALDAAKP